MCKQGSGPSPATPAAAGRMSRFYFLVKALNSESAPPSQSPTLFPLSLSTQIPPLAPVNSSCSDQSIEVDSPFPGTFPLSISSSPPITSKMKQKFASISKPLLFKANSFLLPLPSSFHSRLLSASTTPSDRPSTRSNPFSHIANLNDALHLFDEMLHSQPPAPIFTFTQLLRVIVKMRHYSAALSLIQKMGLRRDIPGNIYVLNIGINCYCRLNQVGYGFAVLGTLFKIGIQPDVATFTTLMKGLVLGNRVFDAVELFKKVKSMDICQFDVVSYGIIIDGLCKTGNTSMAVEFLRYVEEGSTCTPDVVLYSIIIDKLCKTGKIADALDLLSKMMKRGVEPDIVTYSTLIDGLCRVDRSDEAKEMLKEMGNRKITPNVVTCSILVNSLCKNGKLDDAEDVVQRMIQHGTHPNIITYSSLIEGYCLLGKLNEANRVLDCMVGRGLVPDNVTYSILINGYCKQQKVDEALHLLHEIRNKGIKPDAITYYPLLDGYLGIGEFEAATKLLNEMLVEGLNTKVCTYRTLLDGMCINQQITEAISVN